MVVNNYKSVVVTQIKVQMEKYVERRKRRKIILQQKRQCIISDGNNNTKFEFIYTVFLLILYLPTLLLQSTANLHHLQQAPNLDQPPQPLTVRTTQQAPNLHHPQTSLQMPRQHLLQKRTLNVSLIQRNLMSSYDKQKNEATPSTSTFHPIQPRKYILRNSRLIEHTSNDSDHGSNITHCDIHIGNFYCNVIVTYLHRHI